MASAELRVNQMLGAVDLEINGPRPEDPQVDPQLLINGSDVFEQIINGGALAIGEAYMNGWWDCEALDVMAYKVGQSKGLAIQRLGIPVLAGALASRLFENHQQGAEAKDNVARHYDAGNELYTRMLDPTMAYSCGVWEYGAKNLEEAQLAKYDLICQKLGLEAGMKVLDIGCGWGGMGNFAVSNYGVELVGVTLSEEQKKYIDEHDFGFEVRLQDYRNIGGETFDRVWSIGMFEHVGVKNYPEYFETVRRLTRPGGMSLLHTIGAAHTRLFLNPWMDKYIFPGAYLPSQNQIRRAADPYFTVADWHELGQNYDQTLMVWNKNFQAAWPELAQFTDHNGSLKFDERFKRMEEYYLQTCAGSFRNGVNRLFHVVLSDAATAANYEPVRPQRTTELLPLVGDC